MINRGIILSLKCHTVVYQNNSNSLNIFVNSYKSANCELHINVNAMIFSRQICVSSCQLMTNMQKNHHSTVKNIAYHYFTPNSNELSQQINNIQHSKTDFNLNRKKLNNFHTVKHRYNLQPVNNSQMDQNLLKIINGEQLLSEKKRQFGQSQMPEMEDKLSSQNEHTQNITIFNVASTQKQICKNEKEMPDQWPTSQLKQNQIQQLQSFINEELLETGQQQLQADSHYIEFTHKSMFPSLKRKINKFQKYKQKYRPNTLYSSATYRFVNRMTNNKALQMNDVGDISIKIRQFFPNYNFPNVILALYKSVVLKTRGAEFVNVIDEALPDDEARRIESKIFEAKTLWTEELENYFAEMYLKRKNLSGVKEEFENRYCPAIDQQHFEPSRIRARCDRIFTMCLKKVNTILDKSGYSHLIITLTDRLKKIISRSPIALDIRLDLCKVLLDRYELYFVIRIVEKLKDMIHENNTLFQVAKQTDCRNKREMQEMQIHQANSEQVSLMGQNQSHQNFSSLLNVAQKKTTKKIRLSKSKLKQSQCLNKDGQYSSKLSTDSQPFSTRSSPNVNQIFYSESEDDLESTHQQASVTGNSPKNTKFTQLYGIIAAQQKNMKKRVRKRQ